MRLLPMLVGMLLSIMMATTAADVINISPPKAGEKEIPHYIISNAGKVIKTTLRLDAKFPYAFCFSVNSATLGTTCFYKVMEKVEHFQDGTPYLLELYEGDTATIIGK